MWWQRICHKVTDQGSLIIGQKLHHLPAGNATVDWPRSYGDHFMDGQEELALALSKGGPMVRWSV